MNIKINKKDLEEIIDCLLIEWDMAKEDLDDKRANKLERIRDKVLIPQYMEQLKEK